MPKKKSPYSRLFVIDASVARAASDSNVPVAQQCRQFLQETLTVCHKMVITSEISSEWMRHQSGFTRTWRKSMYARRKVVSVNVDQNSVKLREKTTNLNCSEKSMTTMLKDIHLLEAAVLTDKIIVSLDEEVRSLFGSQMANFHEMSDVCWVNPTQQPEKMSSWLLEGAPVEDTIRLLRDQ